jgi:hypothetical protein
MEAVEAGSRIPKEGNATMTQLGRHHLLIGAAVAGTASVVLDPVTFARADPGGVPQTKTLTGTIQYGAPDWVDIPRRLGHHAAQFPLCSSRGTPAPTHTDHTGHHGRADEPDLPGPSGEALREDLPWSLVVSF